MKRCPQCLFLYPDSDENCDFDKTPLETVDESALDVAIGGRKRRVTPIAIVAGLILVVLVFAIYFAAVRSGRKPSTPIPVESTVVPVAAPPSLVTLPSPSPSIVPSPSPSPSPKINSANVSTAHTRATFDPVSTSGPGIAKRQGGKPVIMLTSGGKIEADEVWRTRDGVWYRRNGMVTLLKPGQVKTIVTR